jgi:hypothetical protein
MKPLHGVAPGGESFDPSELSEEEEVDKGDNPKPAPAPGLPVSEEEYRRMKEAARHAPAPRDRHAQEDHPRKEPGNG